MFTIPRQVVIYIAILFTVLSLLVLIRWQWTGNNKLEPLAQILGTIAVLLITVVSLMT